MTGPAECGRSGQIFTSLLFSFTNSYFSRLIDRMLFYITLTNNAFLQGRHRC